MIQDSRRASFGITESRSTESWLVRLTAEDNTGERYTVNRCLSWQAHGGKVAAYKLAQQERDELLENPDVQRYRHPRERKGARHYHQHHKTQNKRAFSELPGISLVEEHKPSGSAFWSVKANVGSFPTAEAPHRKNGTQSFSCKRYGVKGALIRAIAHREEALGCELYTTQKVNQALDNAIKRYKKRWIKDGIPLGVQDEKSYIPQWRLQLAEEFRQILPPKPAQIGVSIVVSTRKSRTHGNLLDAFFIAVDGSNKFRDVYFQQSIESGLWSGFSGAIKAARKHRGEYRISEKELRKQFDLWIKGRKRNLIRLGVKVNE